MLDGNFKRAGGIDGLRKERSLTQITSQAPQSIELLTGFKSRGDQLQAHRLSQADDGLKQGPLASGHAGRSR